MSLPLCNIGVTAMYLFFHLHLCCEQAHQRDFPAFSVILQSPEFIRTTQYSCAAVAIFLASMSCMRYRLAKAERVYAVIVPSYSSNPNPVTLIHEGVQIVSYGLNLM